MYWGWDSWSKAETYKVVPNRCFSCSISLFSRLTMGLVSHSASVLCTNVLGLCRTLVVIPLCPCRPVLSLLQGTVISCTSEPEGDGGPQVKTSPWGSPQSFCSSLHKKPPLKFPEESGSFPCQGGGRTFLVVLVDASLYVVHHNELHVPQDGATGLSEVG